eukprot:jgi/Galph1/4355/GphlegSOOS_G2996.1
MSNIPSRRKFLRQALILYILSNTLPTSVIADVSYDKYAKQYDKLENSFLSKCFGLNHLRRELLQNIQGGKVLEVAVGSGLNLEGYPWSRITTFRGIDSSAAMLEEAKLKLQNLLISDYQLIQCDAKQLPFPDNHFDYVIDTYSLCVVDNPLKVLEEMRRVCKDDGYLLLLEHVASPSFLVQSYQHLTNDMVAFFSKGCHWNLPLETLLEQCQLFQIVKQKRVLLGTVAMMIISKGR